MNLDKNDESIEFLIETNATCNWIWEIYLKFGVGGFAINQIVASTLSVLYFWFVNRNFDTQFLYHPYKFK